jgi:tetratricopeptide (TPR) repeat protein
MVADQVHQLQSKTRIAWPHQPVEDEWSMATAATPLLRRVWRKLNELAALDDPFRAQAVMVTASLEVLADGEVALYIRGNGMAARTFTGSRSQLQGLIEQAAEYIYSRSQPVAFSVFLNEQHRYQEAAKFCSEMYPNATHTVDRSQLVFSWGSALEGEGDLDNAIDKFRIALQLRPESWGSYVMLMDLLYESGRIDEALDLGAALERTSHRGSWFFEHLPSWIFRPTRPDTYQAIDSLRMNHLAVKQAWEASLAATKGTGVLRERAEAFYAGTLAQLHERNHAQLELEVAQNQEQSPEIELQSFLVKGWLDEDTEDLTALKAAASLHRDALLTHLKNNELGEDPESICQAAVLYQQAGDPDTADTFIQHASDFPECLTGRAEIAALRGDSTKADTFHRSAIQRANRLPRAHYEYALFLLEQGEQAPAKTQLILANQFGPHWAEPLKKLGDLAYASDDYDSAVHYYQLASLNAPQWGQLFIKWGEALLRVGNKTEAQQKFDLALGMDLTDQEKNHLKQVQSDLKL